MKLIGIAGRAGAGKDTIADYLVREHGFTKVSWATPLKDALAAMGFPEPANRDDKEKIIPGFDFSWRRAAQTLGTDWGRALDPEIWIKLMEQRLAEAATLHAALGGGRYVISDVRFGNEAILVRERGQLWHVTGRAADLGDAAAHASEAGILFLPQRDQAITNDGTLEQLYQKIDAALRGDL